MNAQKGEEFRKVHNYYDLSLAHTAAIIFIVSLPIINPLKSAHHLNPFFIVTNETHVDLYREVP